MFWYEGHLVTGPGIDVNLQRIAWKHCETTIKELFYGGLYCLEPHCGAIACTLNTAAFASKVFHEKRTHLYVTLLLQLHTRHPASTLQMFCL